MVHMRPCLCLYLYLFKTKAKSHKATRLIGQYWMTGDANDILPDRTEIKDSKTQTGDAVNNSRLTKVSLETASKVANTKVGWTV